MDAFEAVANSAALIGERSRAAMLWSLMGGEARPGSELALIANVSAPTASAHLKLLVEAGLVLSESKGRNRFYRLNGRRAARALESLAALGPVRGMTERQAPELVFARTCYDHLAGELGVAMFRSLQRLRWIEVTPKGVSVAEVEIFAAQPPARRKAASTCLDWSMRLPHLGGWAGAVLLQWLIDSKWVEKVKGSRALRVTTPGRRNLAQRFDLEFTQRGVRFG